MDGKCPVTQPELKTPGVSSPGFCVENLDMWLMMFDGKVEGRKESPHWRSGNWFKLSFWSHWRPQEGLPSVCDSGYVLSPQGHKALSKIGS